MKDLKHTKGEWKQEHRVVDEEGMYSTEVFSGNTVICTMHWAGERIGNTTYSRSEANSKLIASAPCLLDEHILNMERLESLKEMLHYLNINTIKKYIDQMIFSSNEIIKKATE